MYTDIVFTGPPDHNMPTLVETEDHNGASIRFGEWVERPDGYWALRIPSSPTFTDVQLNILAQYFYEAARDSRAIEMNMLMVDKAELVEVLKTALERIQ